jgi:hypothetical protein
VEEIDLEAFQGAAVRLHPSETSPHGMRLLQTMGARVEIDENATPGEWSSPLTDIPAMQRIEPPRACKTEGCDGFARWSRGRLAGLCERCGAVKNAEWAKDRGITKWEDTSPTVLAQKLREDIVRWQKSRSEVGRLTRAGKAHGTADRRHQANTVRVKVAYVRLGRALGFIPSERTGPR